MQRRSALTDITAQIIRGGGGCQDLSVCRRGRNFSFGFEAGMGSYAEQVAWDLEAHFLCRLSDLPLQTDSPFAEGVEGGVVLGG